MDDPEVPVDPWKRFDRWASNLFLLASLLAFLWFLTALGPGGLPDLPAPLLGGSLATVAGFVASLVTASAGIDRKRGWARPAARAILWMMVVVTGAGAVLDLLHAKFTLPLTAVVALLVLNRWPGPAPRMEARDRLVAGLVSGLFLATIVAGEASGWLGSPQSP